VTVPASQRAQIDCVPGPYGPGFVLAVPVRTNVGIVSHKGIMSEREGRDGCPMVIHASKIFERVVESTMSDFVLTAVGPVCSEGFPGRLSPMEVVERARALLGRSWQPWQNCEHLVHWAHGMPKRSPQIRKAGKAAAGWSAAAAFVLFAIKNGG
jgi:hypothetical protein